jgi:hypothetical protein
MKVDTQSLLRGIIVALEFRLHRLDKVLPQRRLQSSHDDTILDILRRDRSEWRLGKHNKMVPIKEGQVDCAHCIALWDAKVISLLAIVSDVAIDPALEIAAVLV